MHSKISQRKIVRIPPFPNFNCNGVWEGRRGGDSHFTSHCYLFSGSILVMCHQKSQLFFLKKEVSLTGINRIPLRKTFTKLLKTIADKSSRVASQKHGVGKNSNPAVLSKCNSFYHILFRQWYKTDHLFNMLVDRFFCWFVLFCFVFGGSRGTVLSVRQFFLIHREQLKCCFLKHVSFLSGSGKKQNKPLFLRILETSNNIALRSFLLQANVLCLFKSFFQ